MTERVRVAVLISGGGSNLQALIDAAQAPDYPATIVRVVSNQADAGGLARAGRAGISAGVIAHRDYPDRASFEAALEADLDAHDVHVVALAGFMRVLTPAFVTRYAGRMVNIHPSLLPAFQGLHTHARALAAGCTLHGCTVHLVVPDLDAGPILAQAAVPVLPEDTPDTLAARVLVQEHRIYPAALARLCGTLRGAPIEARLAPAGAALVNPLF